MAGQDLDIQIPASTDQGIQDRPGSVSDGKQLAGLFPLELHAKRGKPLNGGLNGKGRQHFSDQYPRPMKVFRAHFVMGDVAPPSARNQNFGSDRRGPIQQHDPASGPR